MRKISFVLIQLLHDAAGSLQISNGFKQRNDVNIDLIGCPSAQFKQGKLTEAAASLNVIRARANATPVTAAQVTLDYILDERVRELLAEENRRMTLMRTGTLVTRTLQHNTQNINPVIGLSAKNLLLPIPQSERDLNKDAVLEQNSGY